MPASDGEEEKLPPRTLRTVNTTRMREPQHAVVKVVQVGYKLDETVRSLPLIRMILGYGLLLVFMAIAIKSKIAAVQCLYVVAAMVTLFVLEPIPYQTSCMLPLVLFPAASLLIAKKLFGTYMNDEILRSISSVIIGIIALKSPLSRRLCLWLLRATGVSVGRILVAVMLLVFLVSMVVDATMTTGILAGFVDPLISEMYANNLRIRYASHVRTHREEGLPVTEVDFVLKDPPKQRRVVKGEARMDDSAQDASDAESEVLLDAEGNIQEVVMIVDRDDEPPLRVPEMSQLSENPDHRREQVSAALRSMGVDLNKLGLKLDLQDRMRTHRSSGVSNSSGTWVSRSSSRRRSTLPEVAAELAEHGGVDDDAYVAGPVRPRAVSTSSGVGEEEKATKKKMKSSVRIAAPESYEEREQARLEARSRGSLKKEASWRETTKRSKSLASSDSIRTSSYTYITASDDIGTASSAHEEERRAKPAKDARRPSMTPGRMGSETTGASEGPVKAGEGGEGGAEETEQVVNVASSPDPPDVVEIFNRDASPEKVSPMSCGDWRPTVAYVSRSAAFKTERATALISVPTETIDCWPSKEERSTPNARARPTAATVAFPPKGSGDRGHVRATISTSRRVGDCIVNQQRPHQRRQPASEPAGFPGTPSTSDLRTKPSVLNSGRRDFSNTQPYFSRDPGDTAEPKRQIMRRKRKTTTGHGTKPEGGKQRLMSPAGQHAGCAGSGSMRGVPKVQRTAEKPWVDRVDELWNPNPFLATDVAFRLRHSSFSKPKLLHQMRSFCAGRGDSLRNLLFARYSQVVAAATTEPQPPQTPGDLDNGPKAEEDNPSPVLSPELASSPPSFLQVGEEKEQDTSDGEPAPAPPPEDDAGGGGEHTEEAHGNAHEQHGEDRSELEMIIKDEKEKAKDLRTAVLLALSYGASFGATAAYGASSANLYFRKQVAELDADVPSTNLSLVMWLAMHVPVCLTIMIIASGIINFVHTWHYNIVDTGVYPPSAVVFRDRLRIMGRLSYGEYISAFLLGSALILLATRQPTFMRHGWGQLLGVEREVTDASVGIVIGMLAFLFPADILPESHETQIIEWADMLKRLPWGVIFIQGSSSTITAAMEKNGVYELLDDWLLNMEMLTMYKQYWSVLIMGCIGEMVTFKSRLRHFTKTAYKLSLKHKLHSLFFLLPVNVVSRLSLILPSGSPNNAMAFELGSMTSLQMIIPGLITKALMTVLYIMAVNLAVNPVHVELALVNQTEIPNVPIHQSPSDSVAIVNAFIE